VHRADVINVKRAVHALGLFLAISAATDLFAQAIADTPENRRKEAQRYLQATPPRTIIDNLTEKTAMGLPEEERVAFKEAMNTKLDIDALNKLMVDAMVKTFTAEELKALADFYSSPVAKSAMSKFGAYMAEVMPAIQAEMAKAQTKAKQAKPSK
jgi:hypothetical protein